MPIFRLSAGGLGYFADIPGCGGGATIRSLEVRFGPLAFHDPLHTETPRSNRWSRTSPQHVGRATLPRLFPAGFFVASFALVRHPVDRMRAVYVFQRQVEGAIPEATDFGEWLEDIAERSSMSPPSSTMRGRWPTSFPRTPRFFRQEDGPGPVAAWLDPLLPKRPAQALLEFPAAPPRSSLRPPMSIALRNSMPRDYARFGYGVAAERNCAGSLGQALKRRSGR